MVGKDDGDERVVLIPVTNNSISEKAFDWYLKNEHKKGDKVHVVHCPEEQPPVKALAETQLNNFSADVVSPEKWEAGAKQEEEESILNMYKKKLADNNVAGKVTSEFVVGSPGRDIVQVAEKDNAKLIVMAKQGLGALYRSHFRSVSEYVQKNTTVPVSVYTEPEAPKSPVSASPLPPSPLAMEDQPRERSGSFLARLIGRQSSYERAGESPEPVKKINPDQKKYADRRHQRELMRHPSDTIPQRERKNTM
ncbi:unnamed protein product [Owenia fusiformis]|uniref:Uncharacterized protein n=1 Tax=Owenia fusiformis TaxID=6347 RepID=A0A8J1XIW3_OWEFU|nr:unnamed protein product [Owenia fusiformis]